MQVQSLGPGDVLQEEIATAPVFLPGKFHGQRIQAVTVHGVTKSQTRLSACVCGFVRVRACTHTHTHTHYFFYFTDEKIISEKLRNMSKVTQLVRRESRI